MKGPVVIVWATNEERTLRDESLLLAQRRFPSARVRTCNPAAFNVKQIEPARAIFVQRRWANVVSAYRATGIEVVLLDEQWGLTVLAPMVTSIGDAPRRRGRPPKILAVA